MSPVEPTSLSELYQDLHRHPELGFEEHRTARVAADQLMAAGYETAMGIGGTGVVGVLRRGEGATVLLRADMDALPVEEQTGLEYTSQAPGVMHACGHDVHVTALIGAARLLAEDQEWTGTLIVVFQPAEETGKGALALIADGLFKRFGTPDVVLGQHVGPLPAGVIGIRGGVAFAGSDLLKITLYGRGGHGSRPETSVDPILMAAALVTRLQGIVSREVAATESVVVTVGSVHAGAAANIIPDTAELQLSVRTFDVEVRNRVLAAIERITRAEAHASGADREPDIELIATLPTLRNDGAACDRVTAALEERIPKLQVIDPGVVAGSEDVGVLADDVDAPIAYWILGGADPALFAGATDPEAIIRVVGELPSNHSPFFAPVIEPTLGIGARVLHVAARSWLG